MEDGSSHFLRATLTGLEVRQKQQERQLDAWRKAAAENAKCASARERALCVEMAQLEDELHAGPALAMRQSRRASEDGQHAQAAADEARLRRATYVSLESLEARSVTLTMVDVQHGASFTSVVRAADALGHTSYCTSNGFVVDLTPPSAGAATPSSRMRRRASCSSSTFVRSASIRTSAVTRVSR